MKIFKSTISVVVSLSILLGLSACGGGSDSPTQGKDYVGSVIFSENDKNATIYFNNHGVVTRVKSAPDSNNQYVEGIFTLDAQDRVVANSWQRKEVVSDSVVQDLNISYAFTYNSENRVENLKLEVEEDGIFDLNYSYNVHGQVNQLDINNSSDKSLDKYIYIYDTNDSDANIISSSFYDDGELEEIYDYNYTNGYLTQHTEDYNPNGTPADQSWRYIYDSNQSLIRIENDYDNDGDTDLSQTITHKEGEIIFYSLGGTNHSKFIYSDDTGKNFVNKLLFNTEHQMLLNIELIKLIFILESQQA